MSEELCDACGHERSEHMYNACEADVGTHSGCSCRRYISIKAIREATLREAAENIIREYYPEQTGNFWAVHAVLALIDKAETK